MSQYRTGTAAINSAAPTHVVFSDANLTVAAVPVTVNTTFQLTGLPTIYPVESIDYATQIMTLVAPGYRGPTVTERAYQIQRDFTSLGFPEISAHDVDFANTLTRSIRKINEQIELTASYGFIPKGNWNATTNTPALPTASADNLGWDYSVLVGGTHNSVVYAPGDSITSNGTVWYKRKNATADISAIAGIAEDVVTVAGISAEVATLAGLDAEIQTVSGIAPAISAAAAIDTEIAIVAEVAANVTTVAGIAANVTTVVGIAENIATVAGVVADVTTVADVAANVTTVAGVAADVTTVAGVAANVTTVAGVAADVTTVADVAANVTTVAGVAAAVTAVAAIDDDVSVVSSAIAAVSAVATINSEVGTVSGIAAAILSAAAIDTEITTVAAMTSAVITTAGNTADISLVADNIPAVSTCSANIVAITDAPAAAASAAASAARLTGTSTTAIVPGLFELIFTTQAGKDFNAGSYVQIISDSAPDVYVYGPVTSYSGTTLALTPEKIGTATEKSDWTILGRVGMQGLRGETGLTGGSSVTLAGNLSILVNEETTLTITNYDSATAYSVEATAGTVSISGDTITYTAGAAGGIVTLTITAGTATREIEIAVQGPNSFISITTPTNVYPADTATGQSTSVTLSASAFAWNGVETTHLNSDWQVATDNAFSSIVVSSMADDANKTSWLATGLSVNTTYYWRVRYRGANSAISDYSTPFSFQTATANSYIPTPTATPAAFADPFEGGFYAGMIWNELVQSASSMAIGTGAKTFSVPDMAVAPIVYAGQVLEVRSRTNPTSYMRGTVTSAESTNLSLTITDITDTGATYADWSIMAQYRVIVAPKASGESSSKLYKNATTAAPAGCQTLTEGRKATLAMIAAGNADIYPAAHFCHSLNIGGKTDWYLPSRDELELCWRNLKPTTSNNYAAADRPTAFTVDYKNLGSKNDTSANPGVNLHSVPVGAAYTTTVPAQIAAGKNFQTGESEAFTYGSAGYWSATEYSAANSWRGLWHPTFPGLPNSATKTTAQYVRAVRRSII